MARLTDEQKTFLVTRLACLYTPTEVKEQAKVELGLELDLPQVSSYDPTTVIGKRLSSELRTLFHETRERFLADVTSIPIANQAYRLRELQDQLNRHKRNPDMAMRLMEQAAKELGGAFTNRMVILQQLARDVQKMSTDELLNLVVSEADPAEAGHHGTAAPWRNGHVEH